MSKVVRKNIKCSPSKNPQKSSQGRNASNGSFVRHGGHRKGVTVSGNPPLPPKKK